MKRFKSLFKIRKSSNEQKSTSSEELYAEQTDWLIETDAHSDFIHPTQLELTLDKSKSYNSFENLDNLKDRNDLSNDRSNLASDHIDVMRRVSGGRLQNQSHIGNAQLTEHKSDEKEEIVQVGYLGQSKDKENSFEFNNELTSSDLSQAVPSISNLGWMDLSQSSIEFKELGPSEQELNILLPEGSRLEDYALDLAFQYGHQRNTVKKRFLSILEEFPHYQSYLAITRLVEKGFSIEIIEDAADLKLFWLSSPELWLRRVRSKRISDYANVISYENIRYQLAWETSARLCTVYGQENVHELMLGTWKNEWITLNSPDHLSEREVKLVYWNFISFLNSKLVLHLSEFPIDINEQVLDDEPTHFSMEERKIILNYQDVPIIDDIFEFSLQFDGTIWQDESFQKSKITYTVEE